MIASPSGTEFADQVFLKVSFSSFFSRTHFHDIKSSWKKIKSKVFNMSKVRGFHGM